MEPRRYLFARIDHATARPCGCPHETLASALACTWGGTAAVVVALNAGRPEPIEWAELAAVLCPEWHPERFRAACMQAGPVALSARFGPVAADSILETINAGD